MRLERELELDENEDFHIEAVIDRFVIRGDLQKQLLASIEHGLVVGENFLSFHLLNPEIASAQEVAAFYEGFGCPEHRLSMAELTQGYFHFQRAALGLRHLFGLGHLSTGPSRSAGADKSRSILDGAFVREAITATAMGGAAASSTAWPTLRL